MTVLREGHGRVLWFPHHASDDTLDDVVDLVRKVVSDGPLEDCPDHLLNLDPVAPAIIWDDPDGRAGYRLPWAPAQRP